ncbi:hypothetical protein P280DRAFT_260567 [Massarina eburnea CBS 473.64]|uniref:Alpha/beta-hydrolase n=1 Tax=Massarina eburnea CBS 473.64 TaxID=1395130 RepID=A0A6A6RK59_9PLEO|nr:hypothetical protein P280DRAFT_260567 [Massarina eburnea CBS 473.64]
MAAANPVHGTYSAPPPPISTQTHTISGIIVHVHGLAELPSSVTSIACLWLLHPRLQTAQTMAPIAADIISAWNARIDHGRAGKHPKGLIAVSFDQRNHGTRLVDELHNEAWRQGNPRHAQDMFSCLHGTAVDTSHLLSYLESYIFHTPTAPKITQHLALGISLGGHAAWHCILSDPRITAAVVGIGCPDYTRLMTDRARLSKLDTYTSSTPPGANFLGSKDFPQALVDSIAKHDPAGLLLPGYFDPSSPSSEPPPSKAQLDRFKILVRDRLHGKQILNLSGMDDKLVPYAAGEPFLKVFKRVLEEDTSLDVGFEDVLFKGVGHAFPRSMVERASEWICGILGGEESGVSSKI